MLLRGPLPSCATAAAAACSASHYHVPAPPPAARPPRPQAGQAQWAAAATPTPATPEKAVVFQSMLPAAVRTVLREMSRTLTQILAQFNVPPAAVPQLAVQQWATCGALVRAGERAGEGRRPSAQRWPTAAASTAAPAGAARRCTTRLCFSAAPAPPLPAPQDGAMLPVGPGAFPHAPEFCAFLAANAASVGVPGFPLTPAMLADVGLALSPAQAAAFLQLVSGRSDAPLNPCVAGLGWAGLGWAGLGWAGLARELGTWQRGSSRLFCALFPQASVPALPPPRRDSTHPDDYFASQAAAAIIQNPNMTAVLGWAQAALPPLAAQAATLAGPGGLTQAQYSALRLWLIWLLDTWGAVTYRGWLLRPQRAEGPVAGLLVSRPVRELLYGAWCRHLAAAAVQAAARCVGAWHSPHSKPAPPTHVTSLARLRGRHASRGGGHRRGQGQRPRRAPPAALALHALPGHRL